MTPGAKNEIEACPEPGGPVTVGLDGGYIRGRERRPGGTGCFEVIAGRRVFPRRGRPSYLLAWAESRLQAQTSATRGFCIRRRCNARQQVIFISDGGDTVRELPAFLRPRFEHILDWFHIAMQIERSCRRHGDFAAPPTTN